MIPYLNFYRLWREKKQLKIQCSHFFVLWLMRNTEETVDTWIQLVHPFSREKTPASVTFRSFTLAWLDVSYPVADLILLLSTVSRCGAPSSDGEHPAVGGPNLGPELDYLDEHLPPECHSRPLPQSFKVGLKSIWAEMLIICQLNHVNSVSGIQCNSEQNRPQPSTTKDPKESLPTFQSGTSQVPWNALKGPPSMWWQGRAPLVWSLAIEAGQVKNTRTQNTCKCRVLR